MMLLAIIPEAPNSAAHLITMGYILAHLGLFIISALLMIAGILRKDMDKFARAGLIIAAGLIIGFWLGFGNIAGLMGTMVRL